MAIRKTPRPRLCTWYQLRRRGEEIWLMGKFLLDDHIFMVSAHDTLAEAQASARAYYEARLRERGAVTWKTNRSSSEVTVS